MWIHLVLQRFHARVQKQTFLLFQLDLDADAVKNFQLNADSRYRGCVNRSKNPPVIGTLETEDRSGKVTGEFGFDKTQTDNGREKHYLPVEQPRPRQIALDQAKNTLIDER